MKNIGIKHKDGIVTIEHTSGRWFIEIIGIDITLYEVPMVGGQPQQEGEFTTLSDALLASELLT